MQDNVKVVKLSDGKIIVKSLCSCEGTLQEKISKEMCTIGLNLSESVCKIKSWLFQLITMVNFTKQNLKTLCTL